VRRDIFRKQNQLDSKFLEFIEYHSACFGRSFRPSSGVQNCIYSNRHMSDRYCWLLTSGPKI